MLFPVMAVVIEEAGAVSAAVPIKGSWKGMRLAISVNVMRCGNITISNG